MGYDAGAISPDRRWLTLTRSITTNNNDMYLRDARTGEIRHVSAHQGNVTFSPMEFSRDGRWLYYVTDEGSEFSYLRRLEVETGRSEDVERADWDVSYAYFSKRGTYLVVGINNDARTEIRVYEAATRRRVQLPTMPAGEIRGVTISPSEQVMAFYVNGDRSPSNLYVFELRTRRVRQLTESLNPEIAASDLVDAQVIRYPSWDSLQIPALLFRPPEATTTSRVPVILWIHGGPGGQTRTGYSAGIQFLANHGYAVLGINNRGSSGYGKTFFAADDRRHGEADLDDVVWSKRWLAGLGWADTARTVIMGGSYGGYMTLAGMTFRPTEFAAGVDLFGISNWIRTLTSIPPWWESFRQALYAEMGDPATDSARLRRISPLFHADQIRRPIMVLQGANDPRVLKAESDEIVAAVRRQGGVAEYLVFGDEGHGFVKKENNIRAWRDILAFLDRYVRSAQTLP
jgi:dipeptidyl aminopeptidase/acylaminoacyl peptidase